jgi:hypothetical protein
MREIFVPRTFRTKTLARIEQANAILAEYAGQGFTLTLRQLFYQFVARQLVENMQANYDALGNEFEPRWRKPRAAMIKRRRTSCANSWRII